MSEITAAPKAAVGFAKSHLVAFLLIVVVVMLAVLAYEARKPGGLQRLVAKVPGLGKLVLGASAAPPVAALAVVSTVGLFLLGA